MARQKQQAEFFLTLATVLLVAGVFLQPISARAQFNTPTIDGVITPGEYGTHTDGNNQQANGGTVWYMTWDASNLYIGISGANVFEGAVIYVDGNPIAPINGGTNADGTLVGQNYDNTNFAALQFRADYVSYFKDGYREHRTADGSNGWSGAATSSGSYFSDGSNAREYAIPWSNVTGGMPSSFNWFGYVTSSSGFVYGEMPAENGEGNVGTSAREQRYFTISTTANGASTKPFSRNSYVFNSATDLTGFGGISVFDFTMNSAGRQLFRSTDASTWTIGGNLRVEAGTIHFDNTTGAATVSGNAAIGSSGTLNLGNVIGGDLNLAGNWTNNGTFNHNSRTVTFNGTGTQTLSGSSTSNFGFLAVNLGSSASTLEALSLITMTTGNLTLTQGTLKISSASTITPFSGSETIPAAAGFHLNHASAVSNWSSSGSLDLDGKLTIDGGTMTIGSGSGNELMMNAPTAEATINGGTLNLAGRVDVSSSGGGNGLTIDGGEVVVTTVGNGSSATAGFNMAATGKFTMTGGMVTVQRANSSTGGDVKLVAGAGAKSVTGGTIRFGNASTPAAQIMKLSSAIPIFNLTINSANATAQLAANLEVNGDLTIAAGTLDANNLNINLAGNWSNSGTFTPGTGTMTLDGASAQTMSGSTFYNLTINNANGVTLLTDENVSNMLTLLNGNATTGGNKMIILAGSSVSRTSGHIVGNLQKYFQAIGNFAQVFFEIGTGNDYTPIDVSINGLQDDGYLTAKSIAGDHANVSSSILDADKSVNRTWTLTNDGSFTFDTYDATFNFVAGDLDAGASTNKLSVGKLDAGTWTYPVVGVQTATSTQALGMSSFSDFQLAEPTCTPAPSDLVSWWRAENDATDFADGNDGTLMNGATFATGKVGQAFSFDGVDDIVRISSVAGIEVQQFTIDAWVFAESPDFHNDVLGGIIVSKDIGDTSIPPFVSWSLVGPGNTNKYHVDIGFNDGSLHFLPSTNSFPFNTFNHVAATWDGSALKLYVNGQLEGALNLGPKTVSYSGEALTIGEHNIFPAQRAFDGLIDEIEFYNRALSASEIQAIYNAGSAGKCTDCVAPTTGWSVAHIIDNDDIIFGVKQGIFKETGGPAAPRDNRALAISPDEQYLYLGYNNPAKKRIVRKIDLSESDPANNYSSVVAQLQLPVNANPAKAIAVDDQGRVYLARLNVIDIYDAALSTTLLAGGITGLTNCEGVDVVRQSGALRVYATERTTKKVKCFELAEAGMNISAFAPAGLGGDGKALISTAASLRGIDVQSDGTIWACNLSSSAGKVYRLDASGAVLTTTTVANAMDVAIDESRDEVYVSQYTTRKITALNLSDGSVNRTIDPANSGDLGNIDLNGEKGNGALSGIDIASCQRVFVANETGSSIRTGSPLDSPFSDADDGARILRDDDNDPLLLVSGNVLAKPVAQQPSARDFVVLANETIQLNGRVEAYGNLHANGKLEVKPEGKLTLAENATATASAADRSAPITLPNYAFMAEGENLYDVRDQALSLEPGLYGEVIVADNATLRLSSGEYYLRSLQLGVHAKLVVDNGGGYVNIFVVDDLSFASHSQVTITEAELTSDVTFWTLNDPQIEIGKGAMVQGTLIAQNGDIHFSEGSKFKGAAIANNVIIDGKVLLVHHRSPQNLQTAPATAADAQAATPVTSYELAQNYPNPFWSEATSRIAGNPSTMVNFALPEAGKVTLRIFNETGQLVRTLLDREMSAGRHQLSWNARNQSGNPVAAGVYFYQMTVTGQNGAAVFSKTQRMTLVK